MIFREKIFKWCSFQLLVTKIESPLRISKLKGISKTNNRNLPAKTICTIGKVHQILDNNDDNVALKRIFIDFYVRNNTTLRMSHGVGKFTKYLPNIRDNIPVTAFFTPFNS